MAPSTSQLGEVAKLTQDLDLRGGEGEKERSASRSAAPVGDLVVARPPTGQARFLRGIVGRIL